MTYKVTFTLNTAEEAFSLLARLLPMEHVSVEEVGGRAKPAPPPKPQITAPRKKRKPAHPFDPDAGINRIILSCLAKRPHSMVELRPHLITNGFSGNSAGSRLNALRERNLVTPIGDGRWGLVISQSEPKIQEFSSAT
jgi:hypothetical protein